MLFIHPVYQSIVNILFFYRLQQTLEQLESLQSTNVILSMHLDESKEVSL